MEQVKRYELYVGNRCSDILSQKEHKPDVGEEFIYTYTTRGELRTDVLKVVNIEEESYVSEETRFLPKTKHTVVKIVCEVIKNEHKQRFSAY